jgi:hypothetical protein
VHDPDLGRREADAQRVVHDLAHPADLLDERSVEAVDRQGAAAQGRIAVLAHQPQSLVAPCASLGIELLLHRLRLFGGARRDGVLVCHRRGSLEACRAAGGRAARAHYCGSTSTLKATVAMRSIARRELDCRARGTHSRGPARPS